MLLTVLPMSQIKSSAVGISLNRPLDYDCVITTRMYYSNGDKHCALDYGCPRKTPVYDAESGTITIYDGGYGEGFENCKDGDANCDGAVDGFDLYYINRYINLGTPFPDKTN